MPVQQIEWPPLEKEAILFSLASANNLFRTQIISYLAYTVID